MERVEKGKSGSGWRRARWGQPSLRDLWWFHDRHPALKRWAIFGSPSGTEIGSFWESFGGGRCEFWRDQTVIRQGLMLRVRFRFISGEFGASFVGNEKAESQGWIRLFKRR